jgi:hypothetical protein
MQMQTHLMRFPATSPSGPPVILIVKGSLERERGRERIKRGKGGNGYIDTASKRSIQPIEAEQNRTEQKIWQSLHSLVRVYLEHAPQRNIEIHHYSLRGHSELLVVDACILHR